MSKVADMDIKEWYRLLYARVGEQAEITRAATILLTPNRNSHAVMFILYTTYHNARQHLV